MDICHTCKPVSICTRVADLSGYLLLATHDAAPGVRFWADDDVLKSHHAQPECKHALSPMVSPVPSLIDMPMCMQNVRSAPGVN